MEAAPAERLSYVTPAVPPPVKENPRSHLFLPLPSQMSIYVNRQSE